MAAPVRSRGRHAASPSRRRVAPHWARRDGRAQQRGRSARRARRAWVPRLRRPCRFEASDVSGSGGVVDESLQLGSGDARTAGRRRSLESFEHRAHVQCGDVVAHHAPDFAEGRCKIVHDQRQGHGAERRGEASAPGVEGEFRRHPDHHRGVFQSDPEDADVHPLQVGPAALSPCCCVRRSAMLGSCWAPAKRRTNVRLGGHLSLDGTRVH